MSAPVHNLKMRPRAITQCSWDGNQFSLRDYPANEDTIYSGDLRITARMLGEQGAIFSFVQGSHVLFEKKIEDIYNQNGWLGVSNDSSAFALNTSDGGASGGWSVALFRREKSGEIRDVSSSVEIVKKDFSRRHFCKTRGNNYEAIQWRSNTEILIAASVYGTSDCGTEIGHTEGYVLNVVTGTIVSHMAEKQMLNSAYVCTYNYWQPGDPNKE